MRTPAEKERDDLVRKVCLVGLQRIREKRFDDAVIAFQAALELKPEYADAYNDLGTAHQLAGRVDEAMAAYGHALRIDPDHPKAWSNVGAAHMQRNEPLRAIAAYERAIALNRHNARIRTNLAFARLLMGDLLAGWRHYEARWAAGLTGVKRIGKRKPWLGGRSIHGRTILICNEQGLGDMMQFARFVPLVVALGAKVHLEAPPPLIRIFQASFPGVEAVHSTEGPVPECDEICTVPSLALAFETELHTIPSDVPYLRPPAGAHPFLPARTSGVPRIGLAWSGFAGHTNDANRSIPFERFRMIPDGIPLQFICLQKEIRKRDEADLAASGVPSFTDRIGDFADTAGLIGEVDLVIAVDTSIAHLAGAMGRPTWVLLPHVPDWRWMLERADCPWYPTMRLFRQPRAGDWEAVFGEVLKALGTWAAR